MSKLHAYTVMSGNSLACVYIHSDLHEMKDKLLKLATSDDFEDISWGLVFLPSTYNDPECPQIRASFEEFFDKTILDRPDTFIAMWTGSSLDLKFSSLSMFLIYGDDICKLTEDAGGIKERVNSILWNLPAEFSGYGDMRKAITTRINDVLSRLDDAGLLSGDTLFEKRVYATKHMSHILVRAVTEMLPASFIEKVNVYETINKPRSYFLHCLGAIFTFASPEGVDHLKAPSPSKTTMLKYNDFILKEFSYEALMLNVVDTQMLEESE